MREAGAAPEDGPSVLASVREKTRRWHRQVEARLLPAALTGVAPYARMLESLLWLHEPWEHRLALLPPSRLGLDLGSRRKAPLLRADLAELDVACPPPGLYRHPPRTATALGVLYVLEGSTLGGRVLRDEALRRLGTVPTRFLDGYGVDTGRRWRETRAVLEAGPSPGSTPDGQDPWRLEMVAAAVSTFMALDARLEAQGWTLTDSRSTGDAVGSRPPDPDGPAPLTWAGAGASS